MSADESITELAAAVAELGALPMPVPVGPEPLTAEREAEIREWVEAMGRKRDIRYYGSWQQHGELLGEIDRLRARITELEAELADAVDVSETLNQALMDEKLAGSALYSALTMPTTAEERQAALGRFLAVAERSGQVHAPSERPVDGLTSVFSPVASLREPEGEFYPFLHRDGRVPHDMPETGGQR